MANKIIKPKKQIEETKDVEVNIELKPAQATQVKNIFVNFAAGKALVSKPSSALTNALSMFKK